MPALTLACWITPAQAAVKPVLQPPAVVLARYEDALQQAGALVGQAVAETSGEARQALEALGQVLKEHADLQSTLHYYRDMLIAG